MKKIKSALGANVSVTDLPHNPSSAQPDSRDGDAMREPLAPLREGEPKMAMEGRIQKCSSLAATGQGFFLVDPTSGEAVQVPPQDWHDASERLLRYLTADTWRNWFVQIGTFMETTRITIRKGGIGEQTVRKPMRIPYAGHVGSEVVFIGKREVPDKAQRKWLRKRLRDHFAATRKTLVIILPTVLLEVLLADYLPTDWRQLVLLAWEDYQNKPDLYEDQRELRKFSALSGFVSGQSHSGQYIDDYCIALKTAVIAVAKTGMAPSTISALVRMGQKLSADTPGGYTGKGVHDGINACRFAMHEVDLTVETLSDSFDNDPEILSLIGWHRVSVPDED